jgi:hypothetical protein
MEHVPSTFRKWEAAAFYFLGCAVTTEILVICSLKKSYVLADWSSENEALSDTLHPGKKLLLLSLIFKFKKHIT